MCLSEDVYPVSDPDNSGNWSLRTDLSDEFEGSSLDTDKWFKDGTNGVSVYEHAGGYMPAIAVYEAEIGDDWNHIMVVYNNKQPTIYLNGVAVHTGLTSPRINVYAPIQFGSSSWGGFVYGLMEEVRIYNVALLDVEILGLARMRADLYEDLKIDFKDFAELAVWWLDEHLFP